MSGTLPFPIVMTPAGVQPQAPAALLAKLLAAVSATNPGYTANLPGSLIEDISSTDVAAIALCDSAWVELVNSITPYGANQFLLNQLGQVYGVQPGIGSNTSVFVQFTGSPGYVVSPGFTMSDGTNQYIAQDGGVVGSNGLSTPLGFLAANPGSWAVPQNTVNQIVTSVPSAVTLTGTNPQPGTPGLPAQSAEDYRAQVIEAGRAASTGAVTLLKVALKNVPGVQARLVAARLVTGSGWRIMVGGNGDPYLIGYAIFKTMPDLSTIIGSSILVRNVVATVIDPPDTYNITYVAPTSQLVTIAVTWNTAATNLVSATAIVALAQPALAGYINSITVGQPINLFTLQDVFQEAIVSIMPRELVTRLVFDVSIAGIGVSPPAGSFIISGDVESYFIANTAGIVITQG